MLAVSASAATLLINNQPFPIQMPVVLKHASASGLGGGKIPAQQDGSNLVFVADVPAYAQRSFQLELHAAPPGGPMLGLTTVENGVGLSFSDRTLGELTWGLVLKPAKRVAGEEGEQSAKADFDAGYTALPLKFQRSASGNVFDRWQASAMTEGLKIDLELRAFHAGFLEIDTRLINEGATRTSNVYAAVACRWDQRDAKSRSLCYDNRVTNFAENGWSPFRQGEGRHQFIQRGVDWIRTSFQNGTSVAWVNDFSPSFTVETAATAKTPAHFTGANLPQLGQEAQTKGNRLYSITEIARSNIRSFRDRLKENVLLPKSEGISFRSRLVIGGEELTDGRTDEMFVGWTSYNEQIDSATGPRVSFGTKAVRFGTSYFPYSTLGENFDGLKLPGMDRESFWPLAADTVNKWEIFADDIRRDLRLAKAMGFQLIRLHHLELLAAVDKKTRQEYLDFVFGELRHLELKALVDIYASPEQITSLLKRYSDAVHSLEMENEVLIWGIPKDRPDYWKKVYAAVKQAAPHVRVHFTGYNNTGMFERLNQLGVPYDRICLHSYLDTLEAIPSARGYSLALSSYANKVEKPPVITEWNWRGLTKMTEEERARIYPQIIEGAIGARGIPDFYEFQFNETLCPNPRVGRGNILRHYELLHLSRRLKQEAYVLQDLIRKYSAADDPVRTLTLTSAPVILDGKGRGEAVCTLRNTGREELRLKVAVETGGKLNAILKSAGSVAIPPGGTRELSIKLSTKSPELGFYYAFLRFEDTGHLLRYGALEARKQGPIEAKTSNARDHRFSVPRHVVYMTNASVLEIETAIAVAETLESASGIPVQAIPMSALTSSEPAGQIFVGNSESLKPIESTPSWSGTNGFAGRVEGGNGVAFFITGADSREVENAGMNFILSYWMTAKDSAARKVGLVAKELPRGIDAAKLP